MTDKNKYQFTFITTNQQPCVTCGKLISKKSSHMTTVYVCSTECKAQYKDNLPQKLSVISVQYWLNQGMTSEEAQEKVSSLQRQRSKRCVEYWTSRGYSHEEAEAEVTKWQSTTSNVRMTKLTKEERCVSTPFSALYWINKGYTEEEAKQILSERADNVSLEAFISRYGKELGEIEYEKHCTKLKKTNSLSGYIERHGKEVGTEMWGRKFNQRPNSRSADSFFQKLLPYFSEYKIYSAATDHGEYGLNSDDGSGSFFWYDFVIPDLNLCVEYNGDYWHCNPTKYDESYLNPQKNMIAADIWQYDTIKQQQLLKQRGYHTIVVWESDDEDQAITTIIESVKANNYDK